MIKTFQKKYKNKNFIETITLIKCKNISNIVFLKNSLIHNNIKN